MNRNEMLHYIQLVDRRLQILIMCDVLRMSIRPKYADELNKIDVELAQIRQTAAEELEQKIIDTNSSFGLLDIERALMNHCKEAMEGDRDFTEEEHEYYKAYDAIQQLRLFVQDKGKGLE